MWEEQRRCLSHFAGERTNLHQDTKLFKLIAFSIKNLNKVYRICISPGVFALDRALRMPSGVMSTRDRMLARAGLEGVTLEAPNCPEGVVGVPAAGRAGLAAEKNLRQRWTVLKR